MERIIIRYLITLTLALQIGCIAYYPQMVDIPLIEEEDDLRIDIGISLMGGHGTVSYGLTDKIAVQAYGNINMLVRFDIQGAIGTYKWFEEHSTGMELYCGYGYGNSLFGMDEAAFGNYHLAFTQFNIGKVEVGALGVDFGLGLKGGYLFGNFVDRADLTTIHKNDGFIFEPTIFFRILGNDVKYCIKANYVFPISINKKHSIFSPINIGISRQF